MLDRAKLQNIALFLERTSVTGKEALAWAETYKAVVEEINAQDAKLPVLEEKKGS